MIAEIDFKLVFSVSKPKILTGAVNICNIRIICY